jgi:hypothetical protein
MMGVPQARPVGGSGEMAVGRPFATSLDPKKREIGVVGDRSLLQGGAAGTHTTINSGDAQRAFTPNRIRPKGLTPTLPPPEPSQEGQGSAPPEEAAPEAAPTGDGSSEAGGEN